MLPLQAHAPLDVLQVFRYAFLLFFLTMFGNMVFQTYLVAAGAASLREAIKLFWTFRVLGAGLIQQVRSLTGWRSSALAFMASC